MLILARKVNERIMIGDRIEIFVVEIRGDQVKLGISAPREVKVYRSEVYQAIQQENVAAAETQPTRLPDIGDLVEKRKGGTGEEPQDAGG